jgi:hypothetical protein
LIPQVAALFLVLTALTQVMVGIGLMSVGADNDKLPDDLGLVIMCGGLLFAVGSWVMHIQRMHAFSKGNAISMNASVLYTGSLIFLLAVGLILELHYSQLYPYLKRGKAVTITGWVPPPAQ